VTRSPSDNAHAGEFESRSAQDTLEYGRRLGSSFLGGEVVLLSGELGSGKTVLTKGIALGLGIRETVTSPSFAILNVYEGGKNLYHFDFYRLEDPPEMESMLEDYAYRKDGITVIEWGERIVGSLDEVLFVRVRIRGSHRLIVAERIVSGRRGE
jgi:tRNA threonylcarbamoyladenosine biosynthesis protein TsaE